MKECKPVKVLIPIGVKLSTDQCPKTHEEEEDMSHVSYASAIGSLMYEMVCTRPDIAHAVGVLSRSMSKPGKEHWTIVKRVSRYLCGTSSYGLCYEGRPGLDRVVDINGFLDSDLVGDLDRRISTRGYVFCYHTICSKDKRLEVLRSNWCNRNQSHPMSPQWDGCFSLGW
jgi:hypothetical protein